METKNKANQLIRHKRFIRKCLEQGLNIKAISILLKPKLEHPMTYYGIRAWMVRNNIISHAKREKNTNE